tara:strand:- start:129 stop:389 length:261 start_codon:yes stop_codon:yes gene_type:complete
MTSNANTFEARDLEVAVLEVNGSICHVAMMLSDRQMEMIKSAARQHRDDRGHVVRLYRAVVTVPATSEFDLTSDAQWAYDLLTKAA